MKHDEIFCTDVAIRQRKPQFLTECLTSLVNQTRQADEVVLVFDGPINVALQKVVQDFKPQLPLTIIALTKNVGLGQALNAGLNACQHDWVMRMDTDDICVPNRFEQQINFIQNHPEIDVLGGQIIEFEKQLSQGKNLARCQPHTRRFLPQPNRAIPSTT